MKTSTIKNKEKSEIPIARLKVLGSDVWILGTAHVSRESVEDVKNIYKKFNPDVICVELCASRYEAMRDPDRWRKLDLARVIKEKKLGLLASSLILSSFQKKIGKTTGVQPGEEMIAACDLAVKNGRELVLADREVRTTLLRAWRQVGFFSKLWLSSSLFASLLVREEVPPEEIERLKKEDVLADLFSTLPSRYRSVKEIIVDERDLFLAGKILEAVKAFKEKNKRKKGKVFAVVGAGHLQGIERSIKENAEVPFDTLNHIPKTSLIKQLFPWFLISALVVVLVYYINSGGKEAFQDMAIAWVLGRSLGAGIGAVIAKAHPLTILITIIMAPFTFFLVGSKLWMFSTLTELWINKPRVEDFENISSLTDDDAKGIFSALYRNRVLHIFWIAFMVSTGLFIGNLHFLQKLIHGLVGGIF